MNTKDLSISEVIKNLDRKHLATIALSVVMTIAAISFAGHMLYRATRSELELRGEMDVIQSSDRFNAYLIVDKNAMIVAANAVNKLLLEGASTEEILEYMKRESDSLSNTMARSFTGLYGWIRGEYLDGVGWVPDEDYVPTERPWYRTAAAHPHGIVFVDPYVDEQTGSVMMTIAEMLDDGKSVIALDVGLEGLQAITEEVAADTPGSLVMVLGGDNTVVAHSDTGEIGKNYDVVGETLGSAIVRQLKSGEDRFTVNHSGQSYMAFTKPIEGGWRSVSAIDTDHFYRPLLPVFLFTMAIAVAAAALVLVIFYSLSKRELHNRSLSIQIRAAADIYENLMDINLPMDTFCELNSRRAPENIGRQCAGAQETLDARIDRMVEDSSKPYMKEFLDLSTVNQRLEGRDTLTAEFLDKDNVWYRGRIICAERKPDGTVTRILWGAESIDDEKRQREHLQYLAETDLMTGVHNRISGEHGITELLNSGRGGMFVLLDVDDFKRFNDRYGHTVGDQVIISVANCLKNAFRTDDIVMRLGGDEFAAFAPGVRAREAGESILERFYDCLNNVALEGAKGEPIRVSAGVVFSREGNVANFNQLYVAADKCMYASKADADTRVTYGE